MALSLRRGTTRRALPTLIALSLAALLAPAAASAAPTAYLTGWSPGELLPLDTSTLTFGSSIDTGMGARGVAITPDGATAYVVNQFDDTLTVVDLATQAPVATIPVGNQPLGVAITPDGATAYVTNYSANSVTPIDVATNTAGAAIAVAAGPWSIAITPDGATAYVTSNNSNDVTPIDVATNTAGAAIPVGANSNGIAITPDGATIYVGALPNTVIPIDAATKALGTPIPVGSQPIALAISPDGQTAYTANISGDSLTPIDLGTQTAGASISGASINPISVGFTPDGKQVFAGGISGGMIPIDTATNVAGATLVGGQQVMGVAVEPTQAPTAAFDATADADGEASFDASASTADDGTVARYEWDFGDGDTADLPAPTTEHTYAKPGTYTATLRVTDATGCSTALVYTGQTAYCNGAARAVVEHDVVVPEPPTPPTPEPAATEPVTPVTITGPVAKYAPRPQAERTPQAIKRFKLRARCVRPASSGWARVQGRVRLVRQGRVEIKVDRAVDAAALSTCPPGRRGRYKGNLHVMRSAGRATIATSTRRLTVNMKVSPGLYRIRVRAHDGKGLTRPATRWVRVLATQ